MEATHLTPVLVHLLSGRSGSTLLMQLLGTSDEIAFDRSYPYENRYLVYLLHLFAPLGEVHDPDRHPSFNELLARPEGRYGPLPFQDGLDRVALQEATVRGAWQGFTEVVRASYPAARYYAEKASGDYSLLTRAGIEVRRVQLLRDPRDTFTSILAFDEKRGFHGFGRVAGQSTDEYLDWWLDKVRDNSEALRRMREDEAPLVIRYEDMVADLDAATADVAAWLGVELRPSLVRQQRADFEHHMTVLDPAESVGRWRRELPDAYRVRIEDALPEEVAAYDD